MRTTGSAWRDAHPRTQLCTVNKNLKRPKRFFGICTAAVCAYPGGPCILHVSIMHFYICTAYNKCAYCRVDTACIWVFITKITLFDETCLRELWRFEFINNLMHNFFYSIIILHHDLQHVSSVAVLIFRRTIVHLQYLVSSHSVCCHIVHRSRADWGSIQNGMIPDTVIIQLSSWRWAQRCSKHVEDHDVILLLNK
jgi:hypothetical protein